MQPQGRGPRPYFTDTLYIEAHTSHSYCAPRTPFLPGLVWFEVWLFDIVGDISIVLLLMATLAVTFGGLLAGRCFSNAARSWSLKPVVAESCPRSVSLSDRNASRSISRESLSARIVSRSNISSSYEKVVSGGSARGGGAARARFFGGARRWRMACFSPARGKFTGLRGIER